MIPLQISNNILATTQKLKTKLFAGVDDIIRLGKIHILTFIFANSTLTIRITHNVVTFHFGVNVALK